MDVHSESPGAHISPCPRASRGHIGSGGLTRLTETWPNSNAQSTRRTLMLGHIRVCGLWYFYRCLELLRVSALPSISTAAQILCTPTIPSDSDELAELTRLQRHKKLGFRWGRCFQPEKREFLSSIRCQGFQFHCWPGRCCQAGPIHQLAPFGSICPYPSRYAGYQTSHWADHTIGKCIWSQAGALFFSWKPLCRLRSTREGRFHFLNHAEVAALAPDGQLENDNSGPGLQDAPRSSSTFDISERKTRKGITTA